MGRIVSTLSLAAMATGFAVLPAAAQQTAGKVAFINSRMVLAAAPGYAKAESLYTSEVAGYRLEVQKMQASLDSAVQAFQQSSVVLSPSARTAKQKDLEAQQQRLEARMQELQEKAVQRERDLLEPIQQRVTSIVEGVRAAGGYAMIFDVGVQNSGIVAADRSLDLTQKVIDQLKAGGGS
ncbi:MAG TPA: OmpH family outer membrane protein [Gemmatimonadales bacterium]|jgi:outer membrane protein|nr:OmpH family outer membrane protein [Gemmatimonadales bacterium]